MTRILTSTVLLAVAAGAANADFSSFIIRNGATASPTIQVNNDYVPGATEFIIDQGGMKAALGSNDINGQTIGDIASLQITRHDDLSRFAAGSGPAVAPYFNLWITDGTNYAVIANEPSNGAFQSLFTANGDGSRSYDLGYGDLSDKVAKVYETPGWNTGTSWVHTAVGTSGPLTFADLAGFTIAPPPASYITSPGSGVGSGAPDELGTNTAYGFNWVFGDTLSNYVSGDEGYVVSGFSVPAPSSIVMLGLAGVVSSRRRR